MIITSIYGHFDMEKGLRRTTLRVPLASDDEMAHMFQVSVASGESPVNMSSEQITARFIRADGVTVNLTGTVSSNTVTVFLTDACYRVPGRFAFAIKATDGSAVSTIYMCEGTVVRTGTDNFTVDDDAALSIEALFARLEEQEALVIAAASQAAESSEQAELARLSANAAKNQAHDARSIATQAAADAETAVDRAADAWGLANDAVERCNTAAASVEGLDVSTLQASINNVAASVTPTVLWNTGGWATGSITVPGISDWELVKVQTNAGPVLCTIGDYMQGGSVAATSSVHRTIGVRASMSGDTCTLVTAEYINHKSTASHDAKVNTTITQITGLIKKGA